MGRVTNPELNELSGLVESRRYSDVFYSIEDSGNGNSVYAISKNGTVVGNNDMISPWLVIFIQPAIKKIYRNEEIHNFIL